MPRSPTEPSPTIHKFGGAAVADADAIRRAASILTAQPGRRLGVVSAMAGVTDALLALGQAASAGRREEALAGLTTLRAAHVKTARALASKDRALGGEVTAAFEELEAIVAGLGALGECSARVRDYLVARGEQLAARFLVAALTASGTAARYVDALTVIRTLGPHGQAAPDHAGIKEAARRVLKPLLAAGVIPVLPGFVGAMPNGDVATLGRGGSDLTATLLGLALGAAEVTLWKDVPGLLTADPRIVPDARVLSQIHYREAGELAYYGAKVLHPRALTPVAGRGIPVRIRPFADPAQPGTEISSRRVLGGSPVKALTAAPGQAMVTVEGNGMLGVPGVAARTFGALQAADLSVSLISQASSEHSICFTLPAESAERARAALLASFREELAQGDVDRVEILRGVATIAVVGIGMIGTPGVAARLFESLALSGINVIAIAQGSSELNISLVVSEGDVPAALRQIHLAFQLAKVGGGAVPDAERRDVVLLGFGQVGRTVAGIIARHRRMGRALRVVGLVDRSGYVFAPRGLGGKRLSTAIQAKARGTPLARTAAGQPATPAEAVAAMGRYALTRPILVDLTADDTTDALVLGVEAGMDLVLANKQPLAGPRPRAERLHATLRSHERRLLHEATVGAGLPIIDTYWKLVDSGDRVLRIEGALSGTLGFLLDELRRGHRFSDTLRQAMGLGYTEPDPRDDLSGLDVARKAIILGRLLGYRGELAEVAPESLVPPAALKLSRDAYLDRLEQYDEDWARRVADAKAKGGTLLYLASVTPKRVRVGLEVVPATSPFATLGGTSNQVVFTTARYQTHPVVITGPGAGLEVTAGGVLNDLLKAVAE